MSIRKEWCVYKPARAYRCGKNVFLCRSSVVWLSIVQPKAYCCPAQLHLCWRVALHTSSLLPHLIDKQAWLFFGCWLDLFLLIFVKLDKENVQIAIIASSLLLPPSHQDINKLPLHSLLCYVYLANGFILQTVKIIRETQTATIRRLTCANWLIISCPYLECIDLLVWFYPSKFWSGLSREFTQKIRTV